MAQDFTAITKFLQRVARMNQAKQTELRLTSGEAVELSTTLALLLTEQSHTTTIIQQSTPTPKTNDISIDGGKI